MSQSNVIAGAIVVAFIIFITVRDELPDYLQLFVVKRPPPKKSSSGSGSSISPEEIATAAKYAAMFLA